jgi:cytochrome c oxidase assembly factor CtaG/ferredoxin
MYFRGWSELRRRDSLRWRMGHLAAFFSALGAIYLALASPIEPFAALLLEVHMLQHMLLMMVVPPLLWLGAPLFPLLRGLPPSIRLYWATPLFGSRRLRRLAKHLTHPFAALALFILATWIWHLPAAYNLALRSPAWHYVQHMCFLGAGLLFWHPVVRPYPTRPPCSLWLLLPVLLIADVSNTALSALLTFSDRVLYPYYAEVPRIGSISALSDQSIAGVIMWGPGSLIFLISLFAIGVRVLFGDEANVARRNSGASHYWSIAKSGAAASRQISLPIMGPGHISQFASRRSGFDLLSLPIVGRYLKWRHARVCLQVPLLLLAVIVIHDGLTGPQVGAMNLAGVLPWIHWRGVVILGLLVAGNVFCMGCPFMLPRTLARRLLPASWSWPRQLRTKWLAVAFVGVFLWSYEAFALWDRPSWTAWIAIGYFGAALAIDGLFSGASFCKYVCPIGQFNFVQSLVSPLEIKVRESAVCASCRTKDCIRGREGIPGCELQLFVPHKASNMDCTTCLDCVHACPHDNVGLIAGVPGAELWDDRHRSGIGRFGRRRDLAALIVVLVFGAFANAAGMVEPIAKVEERVMSVIGSRSLLIATTLFYVLVLIVIPLLVIGGAAAISRRLGKVQASIAEIATRFAYALVPLGFGMWLAHYSFHFFTSYATIVPVTQRFAADLGLASLGAPAWSCSCCVADMPWLIRVELLFLDFGLLLSLYTGYRLAPNVKTLAPWAVLFGLLFAAGVWIVLQPMQMRGVL